MVPEGIDNVLPPGRVVAGADGAYPLPMDGVVALLGLLHLVLRQFRRDAFFALVSTDNLFH